MLHHLRHKDIPLPDFEAVHDRMAAMGKHADLGFLWLKYKEDRIHKIVAAINRRDFKKKSDIRFTRMDAFEKYGRPRMKPLPDGNYTLCDYKYFLHVPNNYHLEYDGHYYSVLYTYLNEPAILKATMSEIRICDRNNSITDKKHSYRLEMNGRSMREPV